MWGYSTIDAPQKEDYWDRSEVVDETEDFLGDFCNSTHSILPRSNLSIAEISLEEDKAVNYFFKDESSATQKRGRATAIYSSGNLDKDMSFWEARELGENKRNIIKYNDRISNMTYEERKLYIFLRSEYGRFLDSLPNSNVDFAFPVSRSNLTKYESVKKMFRKDMYDKIDETEEFIIFTEKERAKKLYQLSKIDGVFAEASVVKHYKPRVLFKRKKLWTLQEDNRETVFSHSILLRDPQHGYFLHDCSEKLRDHYFKKERELHGSMRIVKGIKVFSDGFIETSEGISRGRLARSGYYYAYSYQEQKSIAVHRLVCEGWNINKNKKNYTSVNHKDGVKSNNSFENLEWCTPEENTLHAWKIGLNSKNYPVDKNFTIDTYRLQNSKTEF